MVTLVARLVRLLGKGDMWPSRNHRGTVLTYAQGTECSREQVRRKTNHPAEALLPQVAHGEVSTVRDR